MSDFAFLHAVNFVIDRLEGGGILVVDSGGLTRWGISKKANPDLDIESLTRDQAIEIYYSRYWIKYSIGLLPPPLSLQVFAQGVNAHPPTVIRFLQTILRVKMDGILGPKTAAAATNHPQPSELRAEFSEVTLRHYEELARNKPFFYRYLHGWRMRVCKLADEAGRWDGAGIGLKVD